jgi:hypothetical protein
MNATEKAATILDGDGGGLLAPAGKEEAEALRDALVARLVRMDRDKRAGALKVLARHLSRKWYSGANRKAAVDVMSAFGRTPEYREVYRDVLTSGEWMEFAREFMADIIERI